MLNAQIYSEDFESYNVNDYMGVVNPTYWSTWSGATGGGEDVKVTSANASSGTKSIYFSSTSGGPQDVLLKFGNQYTSGKFTFEGDFFVTTGKKGYFNFQATPVAGTTWALDVNMNGGNISMGGNASGTYPEGAWFTLKIEANLTLGSWEFWIDGVTQGTWNNPVNSIATMDLYPTAGCAYYVDDISFDHVPYTLPTLNAGVSGVNMIGNVVGQSVNPIVSVKNVGQNPITSFDVSLNYNGNTYNESVSGVSLASLASYEVDFSSAVPLVSGANVATGTVSNVNGLGADGDANDDALSTTVNPIVPATGKIVVGEEATGTWCQWCPRGAVFMERWTERFGQFFAPIAVHNGDPMTVADYDAAIGPLINGYPSALTDRLASTDPSDMMADIEARLQVAPVAVPVNGATWNPVTRELKVSLTTTFNQSVNSPYRIACVITEDSVTGTGSSYNQSNAYAGGGNGPMGGYENLPSSVPASLMVYDFVARAISPQFSGMPNSFPSSVTAGNSYTHNFTYTLPADWDETKINIIGMFLDPSGKIDNASYTDIDEAVANGFILGKDEGIATYLNGPDQALKLFPNPASGLANALLDLKGNNDVQLKIYDLTGKVVLDRNYGVLNGPQQLPLNISTLPQGLYQVSVIVNGMPITKKLVIE